MEETINRDVIINFRPQVDFKADNCKMYIGKKCIFNGGSINFILGEEGPEIHIGAGCLFAHNVKMKTTDNHVIYNIETRKRENPAGNIVIGNHVWFCDDVLILNNSRVCDNSVVATRALLSGVITEENVVLAGIPARIVKRNINWNF